MNTLQSWLPDRRLLERHVHQLIHSLQGLAERLRESIAHAVGTSVANVVSEIVHSLTDGPALVRHSHTNSAEFWEHDEEESWWRDRPERAFEDEADDWDHADAADTPLPARWARAVAVGCQTAAWWLRRQTGQLPLWTTLGLGMATALVAYTAGPVVAALGSGVIGIVGGLLGVAEALSSSAGSLAA